MKKSNWQPKRRNPPVTKSYPNQMLDKIMTIYEDPEKQPLFLENERVYDAFLTKQFKDFQPTADDAYYLKIYENLTNYSGGNEKIFSQLKHACYELSNHFTKAGETMHKIVGLLESFLKSEADVYKKINFEPNEHVNLMNKKLLVGLSEWGSQLLIQKKFIIDNMAGFFHYKKHEYLEFGKLISLQFDLQAKYKKKSQALDSLKQKLFDSKNIEKMKLRLADVKGDPSSILKSYQSAKDYILPEETKEMRDMGGVVSFLKKHMLYEYVNFYQNSMFYVQENFSDLTKKMLRSLQNVR